MNLAAPKEHGRLLAVPALAEAASAFAVEQQRLSTASISILDQPLSAWRQLAAQEVLERSKRFLFELTSGQCQAAIGERSGLIVTGHQPELFHPGVWAKNFAAAGLARRLQGAALNLIVDNDLCKSASLKVPWPAEKPGIKEVLFDEPQPPMPHEERFVQDEARWQNVLSSGPKELQDAERLFSRYWHLVADVEGKTRHWPMGWRFARGRRLIEEAWQVHNLELPISQLAKTKGFLAFLLELALQAERFRFLHNDALARFRQRKGIRSQNHPVPELKASDGWIELPFWVWQPGNRHRGRLAVKRQTDELHFAMIGDQVQPLNWRLPATFVAALPPWQTWTDAGWRVRPRALSTTLFCRLFLADGFIHGLGGAIYDELTDDIIRGFYGMKPPVYLTLTATLRLPIPPSVKKELDLSPGTRALKQLWRDLWYNPDRHLASLTQEQRELQIQKRAMMDWQPATHEERVRRFHQFRRISDQLRPAVQPQLDQIDQTMPQALEAEHQAHLWQQREWAFCLYPIEELQSLLLPLVDPRTYGG